MSLIEAQRKFSRRDVLIGGLSLALISCVPLEEEDTQNGTRFLKADGQPRSADQIKRPDLNKTKETTNQMVAVKSYTSDFRGSEPYRVHNIRAGSNAFNNFFWSFDGTTDNTGELSKFGKNLIKPGESFSLGSVIEKADYVKGFAIGPNLQSVEVDGGGICQISTTLNALALKSGLFIEERKNHDYYNGWYFGDPEDPKEFGMDATIFIPGQDWVIRNTFSYPIRFLLMERNQYLTAQIYTSPEFTPFEVEIKGPFFAFGPYRDKHIREAGRFTKACETKLERIVYIPIDTTKKAVLFTATI